MNIHTTQASPKSKKRCRNPTEILDKNVTHPPIIADITLPIFPDIFDNSATERLRSGFRPQISAFGSGYLRTFLGEPLLYNSPKKGAALELRLVSLSSH